MGKQHKQTLKTHKPTSIADAVEAERVRAALEKRRGGQRLTVPEVAAIRRYEKRHQAEQREAAYRSVPQVEFVPMLGTTRKVLLQWQADGLPVNRDARPISYDLYRALPWLKQRWLVGTEPGTKSKRDAEIDLLVARKVHLELKTRLASGELISRQEVEKATIARILQVKAGLLALRRTLAPAIQELGADATIEQIERLIWDFTRALLNGFASSPIVLDDGQKVVRIHFPDGVKNNENENTPEARGRIQGAPGRDPRRRNAGDATASAAVQYQKGG